MIKTAIKSTYLMTKNLFKKYEEIILHVIPYSKVG
jgi:hypothetical protein